MTDIQTDKQADKQTDKHGQAEWVIHRKSEVAGLGIALVCSLVGRCKGTKREMGPIEEIFG